jgi:hypothetical protein
MNVDVRAHRAAADADAQTTALDIDTRLRFADLQHLARRRRRAHAASLATVALAAVVAVGLVTTNRDDTGTTTTVATPTDWSPLQGRGTSAVPGRTWEDPRDTPVEGIDLTRVHYQPKLFDQPTWDLGLAARPQRATDLEAGTVISYGVVVDSTRDGTADYLIGIANDASQPTGPDAFRVWVTDLATGETDEQVGPPYGVPIDFVHPDEQRHAGPARMIFFFLRGGAPLDMEPEQARFYAWSSLSRDGDVIAWDTAPDTGWLNGRQR